MGYFLSLCSPNLSWVFAAKKLFFCFIWPSKPVPFEVPVVSDNWICWSLFLDELGSFFLKPSQTTCGDVGVEGFLTLRLNYFLQFSSCGPWRVFSHSNSPLHRALVRYRHTSSSRQFRNIFCWLEILNYCPDGGDGNFLCSSTFLKATSLICEAQLSFAALQKYIL